MKLRRLLLLFCAVLVAAILVSGLACQQPRPVQPPPSSAVTKIEATRPAETGRSTSILVDDFSPQPYQGDTVYFFNRLEGDRGAINNSLMDWGRGLVTTTISAGNSWGGAWLSLNHPIREGLSINFSAILPAQILPDYQSRITGLAVRVARGTPGAIFRLELKYHGDLQWKHEIALTGGDQTIELELPPLGNINEFLWVLDRANTGDYVVLDSVSFTATTSSTDTALNAFLWSYGQLLSNWNTTTGLIRDKAKDASGEFDAVQATGSLAAATASAYQLGVIDRAAAIQIVDRISHTLLLDLPRFHGLWPHWVKVSATDAITIVPGTEWSSVDTVIAALGLLDAQSGLGLDTSGTEQFLQAIDWQKLLTSGGLSHGYTFDGELIPYAWDVFGGESWLVELVYAGATGQVAPLTYAAPPTANGSGFIDELAWLYILPPDRSDYWETDWTAYRSAAADRQLHYYTTSCFAQLGMFGLSAAEVPVPAAVTPDRIYQAFGTGGRFAAASDGTALSGAPVVVPHYAAMVASLHPQEAVRLWRWLMDHGYFTPLTNVESITFAANANCNDVTSVGWNQLKGSWNLALQTLGWGRYLAERGGLVPIVWRATTANALLQRGYRLLVPDRSSPPTPSATGTTWTWSRECEKPDEATVGQMIWRSNASGSQVHGQFGAAGYEPWPAQAGYVKYSTIDIPALDQVYLKLRYSKYSSASVPILIYLDDEPNPRAKLNLVDQGNWNQFAWTEPVPLGKIVGGIHSIKFSTDGQQYGVADLDTFVLASGDPAASTVTPQASSTPAETPVVPPASRSQTSCEGKPFNQWGSPGTYVYQRNGGDLVTIVLKPGEALPSLGVHGPDTLSVAGIEDVTTGLGTFRATHLAAGRDYSILTGRLDQVKGSFQRHEWYVCGYGLVKLTSSDRGVTSPGNNSYSTRVDLDLVSFTPLATN